MTEYKDYNFRHYYDMSKKTLYNRGIREAYYYKYNNPSDSNSLINSYYYGMEKKLITKYIINGVNKGIIPLSKFAGKKAASTVMFASDYGLCLEKQYNNHPITLWNSTIARGKCISMAATNYVSGFVNPFINIGTNGIYAAIDTYSNELYYDKGLYFQNWLLNKIEIGGNYINNSLYHNFDSPFIIIGDAFNFIPKNLTYITQKMIPDGIFNYNDTFDGTSILSYDNNYTFDNTSMLSYDNNYTFDDTNMVSYDYDIVGETIDYNDKHSISNQCVSNQNVNNELGKDTTDYQNVNNEIGKDATDYQYNQNVDNEIGKDTTDYQYNQNENNEIENQVIDDEINEEKIYENIMKSIEDVMDILVIRKIIKNWDDLSDKERIISTIGMVCSSELILNDIYSMIKDKDLISKDMVNYLNIIKNITINGKIRIENVILVAAQNQTDFNLMPFKNLIMDIRNHASSKVKNKDFFDCTASTICYFVPELQIFYFVYKLADNLINIFAHTYQTSISGIPVIVLERQSVHINFKEVNIKDKVIVKCEFLGIEKSARCNHFKYARDLALKKFKDEAEIVVPRLLGIDLDFLDKDRIKPTSVYGVICEKYYVDDSYSTWENVVSKYLTKEEIEKLKNGDVNIVDKLRKKLNNDDKKKLDNDHSIIKNSYANKDDGYERFKIIKRYNKDLLIEEVSLKYLKENFDNLVPTLIGSTIVYIDMELYSLINDPSNYFYYKFRSLCGYYLTSISINTITSHAIPTIGMLKFMDDIDFDDFNKCYAPVIGVGIGLAVSTIIDLFDENKSFIDHIKSTVFRLFQSSFTPAFKWAKKVYKESMIMKFIGNIDWKYLAKIVSKWAFVAISPELLTTITVTIVSLMIMRAISGLVNLLSKKKRLICTKPEYVVKKILPEYVVLPCVPEYEANRYNNINYKPEYEVRCSLNDFEVNGCVNYL